MSNFVKSAPLTDEIIISVAQLVDDAQVDRKREPSHSDLDFHINQVGLSSMDPRSSGRAVGKSKRLREVLYGALENDVDAGEKLVSRIISNVKAVGGFREGSKNYTGKEAIENLRAAFKSEGYILTSTGELQSAMLENLSSKEIMEALKAYVRRAKRGIEDAALVAGTGKDLMEAVAAHVLLEKTGSYPTQANFPTLLGQAFMALNLATTYGEPKKGEPVQRKFERALFEIACAVNKVRNKEGTGHGRPFISNLSNEESIAAIESIGIVAEYLLNKLEINLNQPQC